MASSGTSGRVSEDNEMVTTRYVAERKAPENLGPMNWQVFVEAQLEIVKALQQAKRLIGMNSGSKSWSED